jgi:hypothetical protein
MSHHVFKIDNISMADRNPCNDIPYSSA